MLGRGQNGQVNDPVSFLVNHRDHDGFAPLHLAAGNLAVTQVLIESGAYVNVSAPNGGATPLHLAVKAGNTEAVEHLLDCGAFLNPENENEETPLEMSVRKGKLDVFELLVKRGADIHHRRLSGNSALVDCCWALVDRWKDAKMEMLLSLLRLGFDPYQPNICRVTAAQILLPIHLARGLFLGRVLSLERIPPICWKEYFMSEEVWIFDDAKFHLIVRAYGKGCLARVMNLHPPATHESFSPLCLAAWSNSVAMMQNLILIGADIEFEGCESGTALMAACEHGRLPAVKFLVRRGARLEYTSNRERVASAAESSQSVYRSAIVAAQMHPEVLRWLLVERHTEQPKIMDHPEQWNGPSASSDAEATAYHWSGPVRAGMRLLRSERRLAGDSSLDWLAKLRRMRRNLAGRVVWRAELWPDVEEEQARDEEEPGSADV